MKNSQEEQEEEESSCLAKALNAHTYSNYYACRRLAVCMYEETGWQTSVATPAASYFAHLRPT